MCVCDTYNICTFKELTEKRITSYQIVVALLANPSKFQRFVQSNVDTLYYVQMFICTYVCTYIRTFNIDDGITQERTRIQKQLNLMHARSNELQYMCVCLHTYVYVCISGK